MCEGSGAEMIYSIMRMFSNFNYKLPCQEKLFIWPPFFQYLTDVFCAKKRAGHACICPRMTGQPVLELYPPPKKLALLRLKQLKFRVGKRLVLLFLSVFLLNFFRPKLAIFVDFFFKCRGNSTFANNKRSYPTNLTTPDRLQYSI